MHADNLELIREIQRNTIEFNDNSWQTFFFAPIPNSKGQRFVFRVETDARKEAITLWTNRHVKGICKINGELIDGAICFRTYYRESPVNTSAYH